MCNRFPLPDYPLMDRAQKFEPLLSLVKKWELSSADMEACRNQIYSLIGMEKSRDPLTVATFTCTKISNMKNR
jgi:hypothetical protein